MQGGTVFLVFPYHPNEFHNKKGYVLMNESLPYKFPFPKLFKRSCYLRIKLNWSYTSYSSKQPHLKWSLKQKKLWNPFLYRRIYNLTPRNTANYQIAPSVLQIYYTLIIVRRKREFLMLVSNFGDRFSPWVFLLHEDEEPNFRNVPPVHTQQANK